MPVTSSTSERERHQALISRHSGFLPNVAFRDVMPLLANAEALRYALDETVAFARPLEPECVVGVDARGFVLGGALALRLGCGFVTIRKAGKLPGATISAEFTGEYSTDRIEIRTDLIRPGMRVLLHDDIVATGHCIRASVGLIQELGAEVVGVCAIVDKAFLRAPGDPDYVNFMSVFRFDE